MKNNYKPRPIDTSDVELPEKLTELMEALAHNVHEVWATGRMQQGWKYGKERNDAQKEHPCLIPYEELTEEERDYDRETARSTLKLILKLGFKIESND